MKPIPDGFRPIGGVLIFGDTDPIGSRTRRSECEFREEGSVGIIVMDQFLTEVVRDPQISVQIRGSSQITRMPGSGDRQLASSRQGDFVKIDIVGTRCRITDGPGGLAGCVQVAQVGGGRQRFRGGRRDTQ